MTLEELNALGILEARAVFELCCGSQRWIDGMLMRKPFNDAEDLQEAGRQIWRILDEKDWKEAFAHHPHIAAPELLSIQWGEEGASVEFSAEFKELHDAYYDKFGFVFLAFSSGKRPAEILESLKTRLGHSADEEIRVAAAEHEQITAARLENLLHPDRASDASDDR